MPLLCACVGQQALDVARKMDKHLIDDGNSYSYLLAWLLSLR